MTRRNIAHITVVVMAIGCGLTESTHLKKEKKKKEKRPAPNVEGW